MKLIVFHYSRRFLVGVLYYAFFLMTCLLPIFSAAIFGEDLGTQEYGNFYLEFVSHHLLILAFPALILGFLNTIFEEDFTTKLKKTATFFLLLIASSMLGGSIPTDSNDDDIASHDSSDSASSDSTL